MVDHRIAQSRREWRREVGKGRGRQRSTVVGKIRRPRSAKGRRLKAMHAVSCMDIGPLTLLFETCRLSGQLQEKSFSSNLSFFQNLGSMTWKTIGYPKLSTVGSKQSFLTEVFERVEHRYESGTASESAKRAQVFAGLYSSVHRHSSVSFGGSGLLMTAPKHFGGFRRRARSLQSTPPL